MASVISSRRSLNFYLRQSPAPPTPRSKPPIARASVPCVPLSLDARCSSRPAFSALGDPHDLIDRAAQPSIPAASHAVHGRQYGSLGRIHRQDVDGSSLAIAARTTRQLRRVALGARARRLRPGHGDPEPRRLHPRPLAITSPRRPEPGHARLPFPRRLGARRPFRPPQPRLVGRPLLRHWRQLSDGSDDWRRMGSVRGPAEEPVLDAASVAHKRSPERRHKTRPVPRQQRRCYCPDLQRHKQHHWRHPRQARSHQQRRRRRPLRRPLQEHTRHTANGHQRSYLRVCRRHMGYCTKGLRRAPPRRVNAPNALERPANSADHDLSAALHFDIDPFCIALLDSASLSPLHAGPAHCTIPVSTVWNTECMSCPFR